MNKEEAKQHIRSQIDSSLKRQSKYNNDICVFYYNKSYLRALKLSTITGKPVNKEKFKGGEALFGFNTEYKKFIHYDIIYNYLKEKYSKFYDEQKKLIKEVFNEYSEYKDYE